MFSRFLLVMALRGRCIAEVLLYFNSNFLKPGILHIVPFVDQGIYRLHVLGVWILPLRV